MVFVELFMKIGRLMKDFLAIAIMAFLIMWLTPLGSFSPKEPGFYYAICIAIFTEVSTRALLRKYQVKKKDGDDKMRSS